jgi:hypothetical protein
MPEVIPEGTPVEDQPETVGLLAVILIVVNPVEVAPVQEAPQAAIKMRAVIKPGRVIRV